MKVGKFVKLGYYNNVKLGYGTVDFKKLKTIYLTLNTWITPVDDVDYNVIVNKTRKSIINKIRELHNDFFRKECIVDLDVKTKSIKSNKRSYMDIEITLYTTGQYSIKELSTDIENILMNLIDDTLLDKNNYFKLNKTKL